MKYENLVLLETLRRETISTQAERMFIVDEVFELLQNAYANVKGGLHFSSADKLLLSTNMWELIYFENTIVAVVVYKAKKGLKMVALGVAENLDFALKEHTKRMLAYLFRMTFKNTWMEVSEAAEKFIMRHGGEQYFVSNTMAKSLTGKNDIALCDDGFHYTRSINGIVKRKIIVGKPKYTKDHT